MQITTSTPRGAITIAKQVFSVYTPFNEGDVLSAAEASALNQTFGENMRNNFSAKVKKAVEDGDLDVSAVQTALDEYMLAYVFGQRKSRGTGAAIDRTPRDPIGTRALELAREAVRRKIRELGGSLKDYPAKDISERARKAVEANPKFRSTAEAQLAQESEIDVDTVELDSAVASVGGKGKRKAPEAAAA